VALHKRRLADAAIADQHKLELDIRARRRCSRCCCLLRHAVNRLQS
jgi:hypothetical protein